MPIIDVPVLSSRQSESLSQKHIAKKNTAFKSKAVAKRNRSNYMILLYCEPLYSSLEIKLKRCSICILFLFLSIPSKTLPLHCISILYHVSIKIIILPLCEFIYVGRVYRQMRSLIHSHPHVRLFIASFKVMKIFVTRTHSMAHHRKSPRSQRNLMVIDPLTPSQGHQFYRRLKIFSVSWSTAHPL